MEGKGKTGAGLSGMGDVEVGLELRALSAATAGRQELLMGTVAGCERKESRCLKAGFSNLSLVDIFLGMDNSHRSGQWWWCWVAGGRKVLCLAGGLGNIPGLLPQRPAASISVSTKIASCLWTRNKTAPSESHCSESMA